MQQNQQKGQLMTQGRHMQIPGGFNPMMMMAPPPMMGGFGFGGQMAPSPMPFMSGFAPYSPMGGFGMQNFGMGMGFGQPYQPMNSFMAPQMRPPPPAMIPVPMAPMPPPMMPNPQNRPPQYGMSMPAPNPIPIPIVPPNNQVGSFNYGQNQQPPNYNPQRSMAPGPMNGMEMVNNPNMNSQVPNPFNPNISQNSLNPNYPPNNNFNNQPYNMGGNNRNTRGW